MRSTYIVLGVVLVAVIGGGFFLLISNDDSTKQDQTEVVEDVTQNNAEAQQEESDTNSNKSAVLARYADYSEETFTKATEDNGKAVLFFAALAWCPSCQAADRDFKANFNKVPSDVTILKVDYDTAKDMKQKYAITMQDSFIQVDSQRKEVTRWNSGGQGVEALLANVK